MGGHDAEDGALMLTVVTWRWGDKYGGEYVDRLLAGLRRHLRQSHKVVVACASTQDEHLTRIKGCFARLRMFDPEWQLQHGILPDERVVCLDLDLIVTGDLDPLFDRPEPFVILQGVNASNPCPYNGSVWMLRGGYRPDVWSDFSLDAAQRIPLHEFPDDQGWFWQKLPGAAGWQAGSKSGIYGFQKPGWPKGDALPAGARLIAFPGWRDPSKFAHLDWVRTHWTA